jgi:hypothetical protein
MFYSGELVGTTEYQTEYQTLYAKCCIKRWCYKRVLLQSSELVR